MSKVEKFVKPGRAAILTMEMQRGVIGDLSALRALADVVDNQGIPKRLGLLLDSARGAGIPVIHCRAAFRPDRRGSYANVPMVNHMLKNPEHMLLGEGTSEVIPELGPAADDLDSVRLHGMSPFTGTNLDPTLRSLGVDTVIATGVSLNVGIQGMVIEAINHGYHVVLVKDCVAGYPPEYAESVIEHSLARITTPTTAEELVGLWS
jgi:nicotinamidase-related amidase